MKIGFSLSPGGLLFPYHLGVLSSLEDQGYVTDSTPLAGSSAGAIAVASHASGVPSAVSLDGCIRISERCLSLGGARGNLLPLLEAEMEEVLPPDAHEVVNGREGMAGLAYREVFPRRRSVLATEFDSREEFIEAVCNSSMFPFFTSNWPFVVRKGRPRRRGRTGEGSAGPSFVVTADGGDMGLETAGGNGATAALDSEGDGGVIGGGTKQGARGAGANAAWDFSRWRTGAVATSMPPLPRLVMDGYFTVPRNRFGCPIFPEEADVDRTVTVSVFPHDTIGLDASEAHDQISPQLPENEDPSDFLARLLKEATQASTAEEHMDMYERGLADGERWLNEEEDRRRDVRRKETEAARAVDSSILTGTW